MRPLSSLPPRVATLLALACALTVVTVEWAATFRFFTDQTFERPLAYSNDALFTAALVKASSKFEFLPFTTKAIASLGAPTVAQWDDYPFSEDLAFFFTGVLARLVGVFAALNVAFLAACWLSTASMFFVSRALHFSRSGSTLAAVLFGFSMFAAARNIFHWGLTFYFVVPWAVWLSVWLSSRRGLQFKTPRFSAAAAVAVLLGWSNVYFLAFALELWGLAFFVGLLKRPSRRRVAVGGALLLVVALAFLSVNFETLVSRAAFGANVEATYRNPTGVERFALKPVTLFVGGGNHRWAPLAALGAQSAKSSLINGEQPSPYLGLVGAVLLLGLFAQGVRPKRPLFSAGWAAAAVMLVVLNSVGGLSSVLGLFDVYLLRSTNRVSIFILAFAALFGAQQVPRLLRRLPSSAVFALCLALGALGSWEATPRPRPLDLMNADWAKAAADASLVEAAEKVLPPGAMVFELPVVDFPEGAPVGTVSSYDLFRPYFFSTHLAFSHGDLKGREEAKWKRQVAALPAPQLLEVLRTAGFQALYVNLGGATDVAALEAAGAKTIARSSLGDSVFLTVQ